MKKLKIAVIGGGSSYTPELIDGFLKRAKELPVGEICLVDIDEGREKLDIVGALGKRMVEKAGLGIRIILTTDRREAIKGADFVMTQFRVGGLKARARDERIPLEYDVIGQETTGSGGFAKALRTIPVILDICRDIEELSPEAWLINFTNPAGIITETVQKHTDVKVIGLCNVPIGMVNNIAKMLEIDSKRVKIDFAGLNHLVWGRKVYIDGVDKTDYVIEKLCEGASLTMKNIPDLQWDPVFLRSLGMIPCPYHRYFYMADEMLEDEKEAAEKHSGTRAEQVMAIEKELFEVYKDTELNVKPKQLENRGGAYYSDAAVSLISAIFNDKKEIHTVNVKNNGIFSFLPEDSVIEVDAVVGSQGAIPLSVGVVSPKITGLISAVKSYEALTIEAAVNGEYGTALQALIANPLITSASVSKQILDKIIEQNSEELNHKYL